MTSTSHRPRLAIASNNQGKISEFRSLLGPDVEIVSLIDLGLDSPEETGETFAENAAIKARFVHQATGLPSLADDSGLEVMALGGLPGVRSARYAGDQHDDAANRHLLLANMAAVGSERRAARFVAEIAIVDTAGSLQSFRGTCNGIITFEERGKGGFGYDPVFELPDGRTMAELGSDEKNSVSHRGHAIRCALPALRHALGLNSGSHIGDLT